MDIVREIREWQKQRGYIVLENSSDRFLETTEKVIPPDSKLQDHGHDSWIIGIGFDYSSSRKGARLRSEKIFVDMTIALEIHLVPELPSDYSILSLHREEELIGEEIENLRDV